jgi:hypothetical protein
VGALERGGVGAMALPNMSVCKAVPEPIQTSISWCSRSSSSRRTEPREPREMSKTTTRKGRGRDYGRHSKMAAREVTERTKRGHNRHMKYANDHQSSALPFFQNGRDYNVTVSIAMIAVPIV